MLVAIYVFPFLLGRAGISVRPLVGPARDLRRGPDLRVDRAYWTARAIRRPAITLSGMDPGWLHRLRWRLRGAWLWPVFVAAVAADAALGHFRPPTSDTESVAAAAIVGLALNLLAVLLLSRPLGALLRRMRRELPGVVARNYAGTWVVIAVTAGLLAAGLVHHGAVMADQAAMRDAT